MHTYIYAFIHTYIHTYVHIEDMKGYIYISADMYPENKNPASLIKSL